MKLHKIVIITTDFNLCICDNVMPFTVTPGVSHRRKTSGVNRFRGVKHAFYHVVYLRITMITCCNFHQLPYP